MTTLSFAGVNISTPGEGWTVPSPVRFVASANGSTTISSMIIYVDYKQSYLLYSNSLDTAIPMDDGWHFITIKAWDVWGGIYQQNLSINVSGSSGGVNISAPASGTTPGAPVHLVASATPSNGRRIASMIAYLDNNAVFTTYSDNVDTYLPMGAGGHRLIVKSWEDVTGAIYQQQVDFNVSSSSGSISSLAAPAVPTSTGNNIWNVDQMGGWESCSACAYDPSGYGPTTSFYMWQGVSSPSLDGNAAEFGINGGGTPYTNALYYKRLVGDVNVNNATRHMVYDTYFYLENSNAPQALEFDINQYVQNRSLVFGSQCNIRAGNVWDIWDNPNDRWVSTGIPCPTPAAYTWHHVVLEVERTWDNWLHYISITYDGHKYYLDQYYASKWTDWNGITVNFQLDGNYRQEPYKVWLDQFQFNYW